MDFPIGAYLDDYTLLEQPGAAAQLSELVRAYPWFTLGRYMQLRALRDNDPTAYGRAWRRADVRLFAHPFPRLLLDEVSPENAEAGAAYIMPGPQYTDAAYGSRPDTVSVIDKFLSHANGAERIVPPPADAACMQEDISAESVAEDGRNATETLAGIYLAQGLPDRAVEIYYQLSLKYPEKSAYFADLIADVQARAGER